MVTRLSTMSEKQREDYLKYYNDVMLSGITGFKVLEPAKEYDDFGLRFPIDYLNSFGKNVVFLPLEIMAEYVDIITRSAIDNNEADFIYHQIHDLDFDVDKMYDNLNATAIGNMAYIALNCQDGKAKEICEKQLNAIFVKAKGKLLNAMNENL